MNNHPSSWEFLSLVIIGGERRLLCVHRLNGAPKMEEKLNERRGLVCVLSDHSRAEDELITNVGGGNKQSVSSCFYFKERKGGDRRTVQQSTRLDEKRPKRIRSVLLCSDSNSTATVLRLRSGGM